MKTLKFLICTVVFLIAMVQVSFSQTPKDKVLENGMMLTKHGGLAIKMTANATIIHGMLVAIDTGTGYVKAADSTNAMGVAYLLKNKNIDTCLAGTELWVVVDGIAETRILTADSANASLMAVVSTTAGVADIRDYHTDWKESICGWQYQRRGYKRSNDLWYSKITLLFRR